ncbi:hypothetical protein, partial [Staphylococcus pasteuri]|uniref:hypothetical protein n=1 Tax=Staphylococcus pasteuri TaxID=45972 RepID=UPI0030BC0315
VLYTLTVGCYKEVYYWEEEYKKGRLYFLFLALFLKYHNRLLSFILGGIEEKFIKPKQYRNSINC